MNQIANKHQAPSTNEPDSKKEAPSTNTKHRWSLTNLEFGFWILESVGSDDAGGGYLTTEYA